MRSPWFIGSVPKPGRPSFRPAILELCSRIGPPNIGFLAVIWEHLQLGSNPKNRGRASPPPSSNTLSARTPFPGASLPFSGDVMLDNARIKARGNEGQRAAMRSKAEPVYGEVDT